MVQMISQRLVWAAFTALAVLSFVFVAIRLTGDPTLAYLPLDYTQAQKHALAHEIGTDRSIPVQYLLYLKRAVQGDLGESHRYNKPASTLVRQRLPNTLKLGSSAFLLSLLISLPLGVLAAVRHGSPADHAVRIFAAGALATPTFVIATLLVWIFAVKLSWFPVTGSGDWRHYVLPVVSLSLFAVATQVRITRSAVMSVLNQDFVRTARAKGLQGRVVVSRHVLRNAMIPIVTVVGLSWPAFLSGTVIIETVFAWRGLGTLLLDGASARDYALVEASTLVLSLFFIGANLLTDLSYYVIDPRVRMQ